MTLFVLVEPRGAARASRTSERSGATSPRTSRTTRRCSPPTPRTPCSGRRRGSSTALAALAAAYTNRTGGRVVIVGKNGPALVDTSGRVHGAESFASRPEIRAALAGRYPPASATPEPSTRACSTSPCRSPPAAKVHGAVRITYPLSAVDARDHALLAHPRLDRRRRARRRRARRARRGAIRDAAAAAARGGGGGGRGGAARGARRRGGRPAGGALARALSSTAPSRSSSGSSTRRRSSSRMPRTSCARRSPRCGCGSRTFLRAPTGTRRCARAGACRSSSMAFSSSRARTRGARARGASMPRPSSGNGRRVAAARRRARRGARRVAQRTVHRAQRPGPPRAGARQPHCQRARGLAGRIDGHLAAQSSPPWVELHVTDQGPGLTAEQRERAFDRFWRAGSGEGGSGLGLAIVRRLVAADDGEVELREAPGGGIDAVVRLRPA